MLKLWVFISDTLKFCTSSRVINQSNCAYWSNWSQPLLFLPKRKYPKYCKFFHMIMWKSRFHKTQNIKYTLTASTGIKKVSSRQVLLIKCIWLNYFKQVWTPLWKQMLCFPALEHLGWKTSAIVAAHQSTKGYKAIFKQSEVHHSTVRTIIHKWKTFKMVTDLIRSGSH